MARLSVGRRGLDVTRRLTSSGSAPVAPLGVDGVFVNFATGSPGTPVTLNELRSVDPWDSINVTAPTSSLTYEGAIVQAPQTRSMKVISSGPIAQLSFTSQGQISYTQYGRVYLYAPQRPSNDFRFVLWEAGGSGIAGLTLKPGSGTTMPIQIQQVGGSTWASPQNVSINQWYRIEWRVTRASAVGASDGAITVTVYAGNSTQSLMSWSSAAFATGTYVDQLLLGNTNNSNLGGGAFYLGAYADTCRFPPGPYNAPAPSIISALRADSSQKFFEVTHDGEVVVYASVDTPGDRGLYKYRAGQPMFRIDRHGNAVFGPSFNANANTPVGSSSVVDAGFSIATGRWGARSFNATQTDDPPDLTLVRISNVDTEQSGTDGLIDNGSGGTGRTFTAPSAAFVSSHLNHALNFNGTNYYISNIHSTTSCDLLDINNVPVNAHVLASFSSTGSTTNGSPVVTGLSGTGGLGVGMAVTGTGIPANTTILSVDSGTQVTLSANATATGTPTLTFTSNWSISYTPYPTGFRAGGGGLGEVRVAPYGCPAIRTGTDGAITASTSVFSTTAGFTTADIGRYVCLRYDGASPAIYKILSITGDTPPKANLSSVDATGGTLIHWALAGTTSEIGATPLQFNPGTIGFKQATIAGAQPPCNFTADGNHGYAPTQLHIDLADESIYGTGGALQTPTVVNIFGVAKSLQLPLGILDASAFGVANRVKSGLPLDADYAIAPPDGTSAINSAGSVPTHVTRIGGAYVPVQGTAQAAALAARGLVAEPFTVFNCTSNTTVATQVVYGVLTGLLAGQVVNKLVVLLQVAGVGAAPTLIQLGIIDTSGTVLASTADVHADTQWTGAIGPISFSLSSPYTVPTTGGYYLAVLQNGAFGTTPMQLARANTVTSVSPAYSTGAKPTAQVSGQTTLTGPFTWATTPSGAAYYIAAA